MDENRRKKLAEEITKSILGSNEQKFMSMRKGDVNKRKNDEDVTDDTKKMKTPSTKFAQLDSGTLTSIYTFLGNPKDLLVLKKINKNLLEKATEKYGYIDGLARSLTYTIKDSTDIKKMNFDQVERLIIINMKLEHIVEILEKIPVNHIYNDTETGKEVYLTQLYNSMHNDAIMKNKTLSKNEADRIAQDGIHNLIKDGKIKKTREYRLSYVKIKMNTERDDNEKKIILDASRARYKPFRFGWDFLTPDERIKAIEKEREIEIENDRIIDIYNELAKKEINSMNRIFNCLSGCSSIELKCFEFYGEMPNENINYNLKGLKDAKYVKLTFMETPILIIQNLPSVVELELFELSYGWDDGEVFKFVPNLKKLHIFDTDISRHSFKYFTNLEALAINTSEYSDTPGLWQVVDDDFSHFKNLKILSLSMEEFGAEVTEHSPFENITRLALLYLADTLEILSLINVTRLLNEEALYPLRKLKVLNISAIGLEFGSTITYKIPHGSNVQTFGDISFINPLKIFNVNVDDGIEEFFFDNLESLLEKKMTSDRIDEIRNFYNQRVRYINVVDYFEANVNDKIIILDSSNLENHIKYPGIGYRLKRGPLDFSNAGCLLIDPQNVDKEITAVEFFRGNYNSLKIVSFENALYTNRSFMSLWHLLTFPKLKYLDIRKIGFLNCESEVQINNLTGEYKLTDFIINKIKTNLGENSANRIMAGGTLLENFLCSFSTLEDVFYFSFISRYFQRLKVLEINVQNMRCFIGTRNEVDLFKNLTRYLTDFRLRNYIYNPLIGKDQFTFRNNSFDRFVSVYVSNGFDNEFPLRLTHLELTNFFSPYVDDELFRNFGLLNHLNLSYTDRYNKEKSKFTSKLFDYMPKLRSLNICGTSIKNLKNLHYLEELSISDLKILSNENLGQIQFENIKSLIIENYSSTSTENKMDWLDLNKFKSLKKLIIGTKTGTLENYWLKDDHINNLSKLEELRIYGAYSITQEAFKKMTNLKILEINACPYIIKDGFQNILQNINIDTLIWDEYRSLDGIFEIKDIFEYFTNDQNNKLLMDYIKSLNIKYIYIPRVENISDEINYSQYPMWKIKALVVPPNLKQSAIEMYIQPILNSLSSLVILKGFKPMTIELPNPQKLKISYDLRNYLDKCENLEVLYKDVLSEKIPEKLPIKHLIVSDVNVDDFKSNPIDVHIRLKELLSLTITGDEKRKFSDISIFETPKLKYLSVKMYTGEITPLSKFKELEFFDCGNSILFESNDKNLKFSSITHLKLNFKTFNNRIVNLELNFKTFNNRIVKYFNNVKYLWIDLNDDAEFFYITKSKELKDTYVEAFNYFSNIRELTLCYENDYDKEDSIFNSDLLKGIRKLEKLKLIECPNVGDKIFDNFDNLEELVISGETKITPEKVISLEHLKKFNIQQFPSTPDIWDYARARLSRAYEKWPKNEDKMDLSKKMKTLDCKVIENKSHHNTKSENMKIGLTENDLKKFNQTYENFLKRK